MNKVTIIPLLSGLILATINPLAAASTAPALNQCKSAVEALHEQAVDMRFNRQVATSIRGGNYTFWINSTLRTTESTTPLKAKCVTSKEGEILSLKVEQGRWR